MTSSLVWKELFLEWPALQYQQDTCAPTTDRNGQITHQWGGRTASILSTAAQGTTNMKCEAEFMSKLLLPRVTFVYCSDWCEPSRTSEFQSFPSLALYCLLTGSLLAVWAVHTLYQPAWKKGKRKPCLRWENDVQLSKGLLAPCGQWLLQEKEGVWARQHKDSSFQDLETSRRMTKLWVFP